MHVPPHPTYYKSCTNHIRLASHKPHATCVGITCPDRPNVTHSTGPLKHTSVDFKARVKIKTSKTWREYGARARPGDSKTVGGLVLSMISVHPGEAEESVAQDTPLCVRFPVLNECRTPKPTRVSRPFPRNGSPLLVGPGPPRPVRWTMHRWSVPQIST